MPTDMLTRFDSVDLVLMIDCGTNSGCLRVEVTPLRATERRRTGGVWSNEMASAAKLRLMRGELQNTTETGQHVSGMLCHIHKRQRCKGISALLNGMSSMGPAGSQETGFKS